MQEPAFSALLLHSEFLRGKLFLFQMWNIFLCTVSAWLMEEIQKEEERIREGGREPLFISCPARLVPTLLKRAGFLAENMVWCLMGIPGMLGLQQTGKWAGNRLHSRRGLQHCISFLLGLPVSVPYSQDVMYCMLGLVPAIFMIQRPRPPVWTGQLILMDINFCLHFLIIPLSFTSSGQGLEGHLLFGGASLGRVQS